MPEVEKKTCFVIMGYGKKNDLLTGRILDLDVTYRETIKPAVEMAGLKCVRADEIVPFGPSNEAQLFEEIHRQILTAAVVVADLSTSNANAFYELGVRHALHPLTTVIVAERGLRIPFDIRPFTVLRYEHSGYGLHLPEVMRFREELRAALAALLGRPAQNKNLYEYFDELHPEDSADAGEEAEGEAGAPPPAPTYSELSARVAEALRAGDFSGAKILLRTILDMTRGKDAGGAGDPYITQQLALATYKSKYPTEGDALDEAHELLSTLSPETFNDTETLGLWAAVGKRRWGVKGDPAGLDAAIFAYEKGLYLSNDYYNAANLAFLLNVRAASATEPAEAVADFILARRTYRKLLAICEEELKKSSADETRYWVLATMAEAYLGLGDEANADRTLKEAASAASPDWMKESTAEQMNKLRALLKDSPLKYVKSEGN